MCVVFVHIKSIQGVMFRDVILDCLITSFAFCFLVSFLSTCSCLPSTGQKTLFRHRLPIELIPSLLDQVPVLVRNLRADPIPS
jgi:hypothetical protein